MKISPKVFSLQSGYEYMVEMVIYVQCSKGNISKSKQTRVMVHVFCMSSYGALLLCEVL